MKNPHIYGYPCFPGFFALFKICCLSLNLLSLQTTVHSRSLFCFRRHYSLTSINFYATLYSQLIRKDILDFFSHACHVSLGSSFITSTRRLFLRDLSSNLINFADTSSAFNRSFSMALNYGFRFFISFFTWNSCSSIFFCVNSKLAAESIISIDNLSRRSVVLFTLEFISCLMLLSWILNTSLKYF